MISKTDLTKISNDVYSSFKKEHSEAVQNTVQMILELCKMMAEKGNFEYTHNFGDLSREYENPSLFAGAVAEKLKEHGFSTGFFSIDEKKDQHLTLRWHPEV